MGRKRKRQVKSSKGGVKKDSTNTKRKKITNDAIPQIVVTSPEEKALWIPLILDNIFSHLSFEELLKCRQVNTLWKSTVNKECRRRDLCKVKFNPKSLKRAKNILQLVNCDPPSNEFYFTTHKLPLEPLEYFFDQFSHRIESLTMDSDGEEEDDDDETDDDNDNKSQEEGGTKDSVKEGETAVVALRRSRRLSIEKSTVLASQSTPFDFEAGLDALKEKQKELARKKKEKREKKFREMKERPRKFFQYLQNCTNLRKLVLPQTLVCIEIPSLPSTATSSSSASAAAIPVLPFLDEFSILADKDWVTGITVPDSMGYKIVALAPNLKIVDNLWLLNVPDEFWPAHVHLIKEFRFILFDMVLSDLEKFAEAGPKLQNLIIHDPEDFSSDVNEAVKNSLFKILQSSKNTLELLEFYKFYYLPHPEKPPAAQLATGPFPLLTTLKLKIDDEFELNDYFNPEHLILRAGHRDLQQIFPVLKTVYMEIDLQFDEDEMGNEVILPRLAEIDGWANCISTVEHLEFSGRSSSVDFTDSELGPFDWKVNIAGGCLTRIKDLFPNAKKFVISDTTHLNGLLAEIFKLWPGMKSLKFTHYFLATDVFEEFEERLDSTLTGLSALKCAQLLENSKNELNVNQVIIDDEERQPSIPTMKDLQNLEIYFSAAHPFNGAIIPLYDLTDVKSPISEVTLQHGLNLKPDLKTTMSYDFENRGALELRKLLEPFASFVEFVDEKEEIYHSHLSK